MTGCSSSKIDLVADKTVTLEERAPEGVHLEAVALDDDGYLLVKGTIHSERASEVVGGHLHVSVVEPSGNLLCELQVSIREERLLARQLPKRGFFMVKILGRPQTGSKLLVEYHPRGR